MFSVLLALFSSLFSFFFFNDTATTEIYTLSLHDALPILVNIWLLCWDVNGARVRTQRSVANRQNGLSNNRSEEHTSELQSHHDLVCRLLLEKKKKKQQRHQKNYHEELSRNR